MLTGNEIIRRAEEYLECDYQVDIRNADALQLHSALSNAVMGAIAGDWQRSRQAHAQNRRAFYFSAEFLIGRMVFNNLYCLGILEPVRELLRLKGAAIEALEDIEDAALGNGGLGRLAACFLDSAATQHIPLDGYGLRYKFGLFKQSFCDGMQHETAEDWQHGGDPWSRRREDQAVTVGFAEQRVRAVPYDMPVIGYGTSHMCTLRLWQSEPLEELDFTAFNEQQYSLAVSEKNTAEDITRVLYPNDSTDAGKALRLKQQYFLSSASLQDILREYRVINGGDFAALPRYCAIQLNDTHPAISIPELIRLLMQEGAGFDAALETARSVFSYTNHTVMGEALEKWDMELLCGVVPEIGEIIRRIDEKLCSELAQRGVPKDTACRMRIVDGGTIHMARLAIYASAFVNGVAEIHSEILKRDTFCDWYALWPEKFQNKTNGITQRRWLGLCNPELSGMIEERIGTGFLTNLDELEKLKGCIDDGMIDRFNAVKYAKKEQLAAIIREREGAALSPDFIFDVQIKRLHEYKRQLLNAFSILHIYFSLKDGTLRDFEPTAFIFGAKAAPGYQRAKAVIQFINGIAKRVNCDADTRDRLQVVFVQNYNCSYAEHIIPAADISEQISPAGTEASGTGNMKLMLNGAVTLGTYDGANIEIVRQAGEENNYIFGARTADIERIRETYDPKQIYEREASVRRVVDTLIDGTLSDGGRGVFKELHDALLKGTDWHRADHYFLLLDMLPYIETKLRANRDYRDRRVFGRKALCNIAAAGMFSSDRTVRQYAAQIWHL